jgi:hypothetical protein
MNKRLQAIVSIALVCALAFMGTGCAVPFYDAFGEPTEAKGIIPGQIGLTATNDVYSPDSYKELYDSFPVELRYDPGMHRGFAYQEMGDSQASLVADVNNGVERGAAQGFQGEYGYSIEGEEVSVFGRAGGQTQEVARFSPQLPKEVGENISASLEELYVSDDVLVVVYSYFWRVPTEEKLPRYSGVDMSAVYAAFYDVSNPRQPIFTALVGQEGFYVTSRLAGGMLYLATNAYKHLEKNAQVEDYNCYVPALYDEDGSGRFETVLSPEKIHVVPGFETFEYALIGSIDVGRAQRVDAQGVLGVFGNFTLDGESLYVAVSKYVNSEGKTAWSGLGEAPYRFHAVSHIVSFELKNGLMTRSASTELEGRPLNSYSFNVQDGLLHATFITDAYEYTDPPQGPVKSAGMTYAVVPMWQEYEPRLISLYVFDRDLTIVSGTEGIRTDEVRTQLSRSPLSHA